ncbi:hypothetical protein GQ457_06G016470 [Hibiscus cannabinus]
MAEIIETYEANTRMMKQNTHLGIVDEGEIRSDEKDWAKQDEPEHHVFDKLSTPVATGIVGGTIQDMIGGSIDVPVIINSIDSGHDLIIAADVNASDLIWGVFTECGVGCDEDSSAMVTGHIVSDDYNKSDLSLKSKKITTPLDVEARSSSKVPSPPYISLLRSLQETLCCLAETGAIISVGELPVMRAKNLRVQATISDQEALPILSFRFSEILLSFVWFEAI